MIVAPITGRSLAVFVALALYRFKEKLNAVQKLGIATAVVGIIGLTVLG